MEDVQNSRSVSSNLSTRDEVDPSPWTDVRALGAAFVGFLLGAAVIGACPVWAPLEIVGFSAVVAVTAWWATTGAGAIVAVVGYLFISGFVEGTEGSLNWGGWPDVVLIVALVALAVASSVAGRRPSHIVAKQRMSHRLSSSSANNEGEHPHG